MKKICSDGGKFITATACSKWRHAVLARVRIAAAVTIPQQY
jgi:hypothetical protein